jgi:asparaginyl-tRNA synthetase
MSGEYVYIKDLKDYIGKEILLKGWLYNKTHKGKLYFLLIRDGTGIVQAVVYKNDVSDEVFEECAKLTQESSLMLIGRVRDDARAPGGCEVSVSDLKILHGSSEYPITPKEHGIDFLLDHRHLWLRSRKQHAILRIRHQITRSIRDFFDENDFTLIDAPIFTPSACEGTTTLFETKYFDQSAYLTQSGQLYMEAACAAFGKVYCFGPTFRAEKSKTRRHLTEFWMVEPEVAFAQLDDVIQLAQDLILRIVEDVLNYRRQELEVLERDLYPLEKIKAPFPQITYDEALKLLKEKAQEAGDETLVVKWGDDFGGHQETVLSENYERPLIITRYPAQCKAFYMEPDPTDSKLVLCFDLFAPEGYGEIIGGAQRIEDFELLVQRVREHNLPEDAFSWYLDLRRYGSFPHAGFGLGIERTVAWICGLKHIREAIPFPRTIYRLTP